MSNPDVSPAIIDKAASSDLQYIPLVDVHGTLTSLFGLKDVQSTEEFSEGNRFRPCAVSAGTLHDVCQATLQSFGGKMATGSQSFNATCVVYETCSAILNILKSEKISPKRNLLSEKTVV